MSHPVHNPQSHDWGKEEVRGENQRKCYLFRFHFEHTRTGENTPWPRREEIRLVFQLSPMI